MYVYIYMMLGKLNVFNLLKWILVLKLNANLVSKLNLVN